MDLLAAMHQSAPVGSGLYGNNGRQILRLLDDRPLARLVAFAGLPRAALTPATAGRRGDT